MWFYPFFHKDNKHNFIEKAPMDERKEGSIFKYEVTPFMNDIDFRLH